jgi:hypothetical protein
MTRETLPEGPKSNLRLPRSVWALGFVSMFMDISSEMIHAVLPIARFQGERADVPNSPRPGGPPWQDRRSCNP